jgi:hypothetical protein
MLPERKKAMRLPDGRRFKMSASSLGELLYQIAERGVTLRCGQTEDRLHYTPPGALEPELLDELRKHKQEIITIIREDQEMRRTGLIQSERQVFDLAREFFGLDEPHRDGEEVA